MRAVVIDDFELIREIVADRMLVPPQIRTWEDVLELAGDLATEEADLRRARALKLDLSPGFRQDRAGFIASEALHLWEKEVLLPTLGRGYDPTLERESPDRRTLRLALDEREREIGSRLAPQFVVRVAADLL